MVDFSCEFLWWLKFIDQGFVHKNFIDTSLCFTQRLQNRIFNVQKLFLICSIFFDNFSLFLFKVWIFYCNDLCQHLLFQSTGCDSEVNNCYFYESLRRVMRIWKCCRHEEFKCIVIREWFVTNLNDTRIWATWSLDLLSQDWIQRSIQLFLNVFQQNPFSILNCKLECSHQCISDFDDINSFRMLFRKILNEFVCLILWVNHQWPSSGLVNNDTIFSWVVIFWKLCNVPSLNLNWLS